MHLFSGQISEREFLDHFAIEGLFHVIGPSLAIERNKGGNLLSFATEIIIEIKQFNFGRMASHPFIKSNSRYMVFPLRNPFTIENDTLYFFLYKSFYILILLGHLTIKHVKLTFSYRNVLFILKIR